MVTPHARGGDFFGPVDTVLLVAIHSVLSPDDVHKINHLYFVYLQCLTEKRKNGIRVTTYWTLEARGRILESLKYNYLTGTGVEYAISMYLDTKQKL